MSKSWFNWRSLRRPQGAARPLPELPAEADVVPTLRLTPQKRPLWARFGRKPSPFEMRPGAIESWMKAPPSRPASKTRPKPGAISARKGDDNN